MSEEDREQQSVLADQQSRIAALIEEARKRGAISLDLSNRRLIELPESIGQLSQLQSLTLNNNQLSTLPESISQLSQLKILYLNDNQLSALPESIGQLSQLQTHFRCRQTAAKWSGYGLIKIRRGAIPLKAPDALPNR